MTGQNCQSCGTPFQGKYCYACGEKEFDKKDLSGRKLLAQTIDVFTHFDGKFFLTMKYLLFSPGKLTAEYLTGRRVKLMKPVQLYFIIGVAFFFLFGNWDMLYNKTQIMLLDNIENTTEYAVKPRADLYKWQRRMHDIIAKKAELYGKTFQQMTFTIDFSMKAISKGFAFLMIPGLALSLWLVGFNKYRGFIPHVIHAIHLWTFFLTFSVIWLGAFNLISRFTGSNQYDFFFFPLGIVMLIYIYLSMRKVFSKDKLWLAIPKYLVVVVLGFGAVFMLYRNMVTWIALLWA